MRRIQVTLTLAQQREGFARAIVAELMDTHDLFLSDERVKHLLLDRYYTPRERLRHGQFMERVVRR